MIVITKNVKINRRIKPNNPSRSDLGVTINLLICEAGSLTIGKVSCSGLSSLYFLIIKPSSAPTKLEY